MEPLSVRVTPDHLADLKAAMPDGSPREALRISSQIGLNTMLRPGFLDALEAHHLLGELQQLANRLPLGRTLSGARQFEELPEPEALAAAELPAVVTTGQHVLLVDQLGQVLAVSFGTAPEIGARGLNDSIGGEVAIGTVVVMTGQLGAALVEVLHAGPGRTAKIHGGLQLARLQSGQVRITYGPVSLEVPDVLLWQLQAELNAGIARQVAEGIGARRQLEKQLQTSPGQEVEA